MADRDTHAGLVFLSFVVGGIVGGILGILFAPKAGKETRGDIAEAAAEVKKEAEKFAREAKQRVDGFVEESKEVLARLGTKEKEKEKGKA
ncbi:MAG: YtxH domain-containing protein [Candidatus Coatesbacteria bacterium]|nr:MAG: YtxH domain-containing protein [Candidatus Coatesbacteria bacterium]